MKDRIIVGISGASGAAMAVGLLRQLRNHESVETHLMPMVLSFYNHPDSLDACMKHIIGKILDQFDIEGEAFSRWEGA